MSLSAGRETAFELCRITKKWWLCIWLLWWRSRSRNTPWVLLFEIVIQLSGRVWLCYATGEKYFRLSSHSADLANFASTSQTGWCTGCGGMQIKSFGSLLFSQLKWQMEQSTCSRHRAVYLKICCSSGQKKRARASCINIHLADTLKAVWALTDCTTSFFFFLQHFLQS